MQNWHQLKNKKHTWKSKREKTKNTVARIGKNNAANEEKKTRKKNIEITTTTTTPNAVQIQWKKTPSEKYAVMLKINREIEFCVWNGCGTADSRSITSKRRSIRFKWILKWHLQMLLPVFWRIWLYVMVLSNLAMFLACFVLKRSSISISSLFNPYISLGFFESD